MINGVNTPASSPSPANAKPALSTGGSIYGTGTNTAMASDMATVTQKSVGGGQPFNNREPYLVLTTCIATVGIYPSRS